MSTDPQGANFAARLFEQLLPFQALDQLGHLWALCDGIYAMFQAVEELTAERDDGLSGWANMVDINACPSQYLPYLAQFVGAQVQPGLSDADQRAYIMSLPGFNRGRPETIISVVKATLTGSKFVDLQERASTAWRYTVVTRPSETPNPAATVAAIQSQKVGPDQFTHLLVEHATYGWLAGEYATYADVLAAYATYADLANATL
ncbi:MAG TPA: phage tail protein [Scandinavium sp.]|jgi:hypothetical protein|uniref:phage tail protein n=1 Tax=Scandinavium sp. TaxID=2830653 RepID=UPI002E3488EC|nr:phage tail protein [Scandinavium sp.]HEX4501085.1 phage tail protein [Scandinavium sp.]